MKPKKSYFYRVWSVDRCGNKRSSSWRETKAHSKKEVRDSLRWREVREVNVLSYEQMQAVLASNPNTEVFYL